MWTTGELNDGQQIFVFVNNLSTLVKKCKCICYIQLCLVDTLKAACVVSEIFVESR
jgi:hypothetical protein